MLVGLVGFGAVAYRASLINGTEAMNRRMVGVQKRLFDLEREIAHRRIERESLSGWRHVGGMIKKYNLPLRAPDPRQVRLMGPELGGQTVAAAKNLRGGAALVR
jgi:hypothetical protein